MRSFKLLLVGVAVVVVVFAASAVAASAEPDRDPGQGRCVSGDEFEESSCNIETHKGPYSWCWENGWSPKCPPLKFPIWELPALKAADSSLAIACKKFSGEVTGDTGSVLSLTASTATGSCSIKERRTKASCTKVVVGPLQAELSTIEGTSASVGVALGSTTEPLLELECAGKTISIAGRALGSVPSGKAEKKLAFAFGESQAELILSDDGTAAAATTFGAKLDEAPAKGEKKVSFEIKCGRHEPGSEEEVKSEAC